MLEEAIEVIRLLWQGGEQTHRGQHYTVDHARIYTLPDEPPPIAVAAAKPNAAELAGTLGDGLVTTDAGRGAGRGVPLGRRRRAALRPGHGSAGPRTRTRRRSSCTSCGRPPRSAARTDQELPRPSDFEQRSRSRRRRSRRPRRSRAGPTPSPCSSRSGRGSRPGFDHIALHQVGPDQDGFLRFWREELQPRLG